MPPCPRLPGRGEAARCSAGPRYRVAVNTPDERQDAPQRRVAARVLLLDAAGRVLLFRGFDPAKPDERYWFTPGGALDDGEHAAEAAARELAEEVGLHVTAEQLGPVVHHEITEFSWGPHHFRQEQDFFRYQVDSWQVDSSGFDEWERRTIDDNRWWSVAELRNTTERFYPLNLVAILKT